MCGYGCLSDLPCELAHRGRIVEIRRDLHMEVIGQRGVQTARLVELLLLEVGERCAWHSRCLDFGAMAP